MIFSKIFGEYPQVKIVEVFVDNFNEDLSISDIIWLTDIPLDIVQDCIYNLLREKIIINIEENQKFHLNIEKTEVKLILLVLNFIVCEKLAEKLEELGLKQIEEI